MAGRLLSVAGSNLWSMNTPCPNCHSSQGIRFILYGLPDGPPDESKITLGGCCVEENAPSFKCIECGWSDAGIATDTKGGMKWVE